MNARPKPPAWAVLEQALLQRRSVVVTYHDRPRQVCPHALGWKNGRAKVLAHQAADNGPADPRQQWRSMFIDDIHHAVMTDHPWHTADNYTPATTGIDDLATHIPID